MDRSIRNSITALAAVFVAGVVVIWGWKWRSPQPAFGEPAPAAVTPAGGTGQSLHVPAGTLSRPGTRVTAERVAAIRKELASGRDAPTGQGFKVGAGGLLEEAPTRRVQLLDELGRLDLAAAAALAREILRGKTSADEWAVALRHLARTAQDPANRAFLEGKMRELLTHAPWQRESSAGYLEAFDVAVHLGGTSLVPELAALVRLQDNRAVSHAAYLALDRLTLSEPAALLGKLADEPELMAGREVTRANYFARADPGDASQRALLERYLLEARRTPAELETFAGLFPSANFMVSHNLLTATVTPGADELRQRDRAALAAVRDWLADPRFAGRRAPLEKMHARIEQFVRQAEAR